MSQAKSRTEKIAGANSSQERPNSSYHNGEVKSRASAHSRPLSTASLRDTRHTVVLKPKSISS